MGGSRPSDHDGSSRLPRQNKPFVMNADEFDDRLSHGTVSNISAPDAVPRDDALGALSGTAPTRSTVADRHTQSRPAKTAAAANEETPSSLDEGDTAGDRRPVVAMPVPRPVLEGHELGFVLLEDCDNVRLVSLGNHNTHIIDEDGQQVDDDGTGSHPLNNLLGWMDVDVPISSHRDNHGGTRGGKSHCQEERSVTSGRVNAKSPWCLHCYLHLTPIDGTEIVVNKTGSGLEDAGSELMDDGAAEKHENIYLRSEESPTKSSTVVPSLSASKSDATAPRTRLAMVSDGPRYDGTVQGTKPDKDLCSCKYRPLQRSDAALLMGVALTSHDFGHLEILSIRVCRYYDAESGYSNDSSKGNIKTTILMTFTCREIVRRPKGSKVSSTEEGKRRYITNSAKPLPASTQLLLNLLRCDWDSYDAKVQEYEQRVRHDLVAKLGAYRGGMTTRKRAIPFFPSKMSLEGVYQRIHGADSVSSAFISIDNQESLSPQDAPTSTHADVTLTTLPSDILCHRIGSYLRARSLDALRNSCKRLHRTLRNVVPGLKLKLYSHQIKSLAWMRLRETTQLVEGDLLPINHHTAVQRMINLKDGDVHRAASGGGSVVLRPRDSTIEGVRISQLNGDELEINANAGSPLSRTVARGGLLCDDPGLGKTITVLALVLQTLGVSTESKDTEHGGDSKRGTDSEQSDTASEGIVQDDDWSDSDECIFKEYWNEVVVPEFRVQTLTKMFNSFLRDNPEMIYFYESRDEGSSILSDPICLKDVRKRIESSVYGASFATFQTDVELCFMNAMLSNSMDHILHQASRRLSDAFDSHVKEFKHQQVQSAKKSFARASRKPDSKVAALVVENNLRRLKSSLVPSSGTLLVVPTVLLDHWTEQLKMHVDPAYCTDKVPLVFEYTGTNETGLRMEEIMVQCQVKKTHYAYIFIDRTGTKKLPTPFFLAMFRIVITTSQRFSSEWKNGSFEDELRRQGMEESDDDSPYRDFRRDLAEAEESCPLLKVNWLRMVVDEGHSMGRGKDNSSISFASWINAERRWAMTGTPTRQNMTQSGLSNLLNLMHYLKHNFFTHQFQGDSIWSTLITRGWNRGYLSSFFRLRSLLSLLMVRHTKRDIEELLPPQYKVTTLPMSQDEVSTYNTLVSAAQSNLIITSMEGRTSGRQDSLLHKTQAKFAREAITNLRLVCAGGTQVRPTLSPKNWIDFCKDFDACNENPVARKEIRLFVSRATTGQLSSCACCKMMLFTLLVFPCGHLVCTECVDNKTTTCVICDKDFDVDLFQKLQPGFEFNWLHNIEEEAKLNSRRGNGMTDGVASDEDGDNDDFIGNGARAIMQPNGGGNMPQDILRMRTNKFGDGHVCVYSPNSADGKCRLCFKEHEYCYLVEENRHCRECYRQVEDCPKSETKSLYVIQKLFEMYSQQKEARHASNKARLSLECGLIEKRPLKVIVFSQFRSVLNMTGDRLLRRFGTGCVAEYWGMYRRKELQKFICDEKCFCMILGKDGSEGLDLSFVTHIFFMEQVWDQGLESQAVARAWRMGAKGPVMVETLIAKNTIEETMASLERSLEQGPEASSEEIQSFRSISENNKASEYQKAKVRHLLTGLKLITTSSKRETGVKRKAQAEGVPPDAPSDLDGNASITSGFKKRSMRHGVRFYHNQVR